MRTVISLSFDQRRNELLKACHGERSQEEDVAQAQIASLCRSR